MKIKGYATFMRLIKLYDHYMKCFGTSYLFICKKKWKYIKFKTEANG